MQVRIKDGKRTLKLTKAEHDKLMAAHRLLAEIGDIAKDTEATEASDSLHVMARRYPAPDAKQTVSK